jgi:mannose-1-phosphate guanylyltransferase
MLSVIMAGGVGQRFWPRSRKNHPKQLIDLTGGGSMISLTVDRVRRFSKPEETFIITNADQLAAVRRAVDGRVPAGNIVGEPVGRNTAPCIGLGAILLRKHFGDQPFIVLPADHLVRDMDTFDRSVRAAAEHVSRFDSLLTFGIRPTRAETGYGYIKGGELLAEPAGVSIFRAESFLEKPTAERAQQFVDSKNYFWNSGMFVWRTEVILEAIESLLPEVFQRLTEIDNALGTQELQNVLNSTYPKCPAVSIDYGVMEKAQNVVVLRGDFYWNDIGNWESIREVYSKDADGNVLVGDHLLIESHNNTVFSPDKLIGVVGLDNVVVVDGGDAILVCHRDHVQNVRALVEGIERSDRKDLV